MTDLPISLGELLHLLIQSTYHELSQLSELLPTRTDMERKMQLAKFSRRTNHQFVRLLALANWASSPETSNNLSTFTAHLDMQSGIYVQTADKLYLQEKQTLKGSELPQFCIVSAVDILRFVVLYPIQS
ncbi:mediator of RNA polymerase II transcription subunit 14-like [Oopsacas minuta]|uniref:Mediator of RNA polymerase II transcription subunit 14 n=1 Tax=Oopsacas minuta TaxID=111878 RepID=A0AAV7KDC8_9METZ|nr:mediator of RNA polymerase II transcription subunit 14-like [Oopsacas minuta]